MNGTVTRANINEPST